jgi:hypothetical protein
MDNAPESNPLWPVVAAFVITLPFDYDAYLIHRDLSEFGILIIGIKAVFFVHRISAIADPSRRQSRRTGLLFASFSRA